MNEMISYEADFDREYETLSEKHENIKRQLEDALSSYIEKNKGNVVTIQGPFGSGKTQLLYHLFKFIWEKGCIGIYAHLEEIIPSQETGASGYADYLKDLVNKEVGVLRKGKSILMIGKVKDYAINHIRKIDGDAPIILFVDEIEQQYKRLNEKVRTDDNSPMREVIARVNRGDAGFYLVLAFAPVSFYEFSRGEAQTGRFLPIILPIVEPKTFRGFFGGIGNLIWWMGRGRYRGVSRTQDILKANILDINKISKKELYDVCKNTGSIGGVQALDFESIEKIGDFNSFKDSFIHLWPKEKGTEIYGEDIQVVKKCRVYKGNNMSEILDKSLWIGRISKRTNIAYYLSIILDGLSSPERKIPLFTDPEDWKYLFSIVEDIILEFEGESELPSDDLKKLEDNISDISYNIRSNAEKESEPLEEGYCITPKFLLDLFPFPISSPNLMPDVPIEQQRESLGDQTYLGKEDNGGISVYFFLNIDKIKEYLSYEDKTYLNETKMLVAVNLGEENKFDMLKVAQWLNREGRFYVLTPRSILSDFLISFCYWVRNEKGESLPVLRLSEKMIENQTIPEKDKARKIAYYNSRVKEYLNSAILNIPPTKYSLKDKTGFGEFKSARIGLAQEIIGFAFIDGKNDFEAVYNFRKEFENTQFVRKESTDKKTGVPSALENLIVKGSKGRPALGATLKRIKESFNKYIPDLKEIAEELNIDEFATIPADEDSSLIFKGLFLYLKEWRDPSKGEEKFQKAKSNWANLIKKIDSISTKIREFEKLAEANILLTHRLEPDKNKIINVGNIVEKYKLKISPYTKVLLSTFIDKTIDVIEPKLNEVEKRFKEFQYSIEDKIKGYRSAFENIETFEKDTFEYINKSKKKLQKEFQQKFKDVSQELSKGAKIDLDNLPDVESFNESMEEIIDELNTLEDINENIRACKTKAQKINEMLKRWG